jgi:selenocysteine-specific elongation factor
MEVAELRRGAVLADRSFEPANELRVSFAPLLTTQPPAARRTPVRVSLGAAELLGTLAFERSRVGGEDGAATLRLRGAAVTYPGQPFVVRALSPATLLGGGRIAGRGDRGRGLAPTPDREAIARILAAHDVAVEPAQLAREANVLVERAKEIAEAMVASGAARRLAKPTAYLSASAADALSARVAAVLQRREMETPWIAGTTLLALARELMVDEPYLLRFLASEVHEKRIETRAGYYFRPQHRPRLSDEQRSFFASAVPADAAALVPAPLDAVVDGIRRARIAGLAQAFDMLVATGALVKVGADVYRGAQIETIRRRLEDAAGADGTLTPARFRDAVGTTRKYAVPLLEWFDATGVTVRDGDVRRLRSSRAQPKTPA